MNIPNEVRSFFDEDGRLKQWPAKYSKKLLALEILAEKFETGRKYTEIEINAILNASHTYNDPVSLRRSLIEMGVLARTQDGKEYWKSEKEVKS